MHIPDGFLATPVWLTLDVAGAAGIGYLARRAQHEMEEARAPLLGVIGAFVFAAQMINFPVGVGTSGHLLGSALLTYTLGPASAAVVMTAILALQALVFQDGGILALGANVFNMAIIGVFVAYLPYRYWGSGRWRSLAIFAGAFLSVLVGACMALSELLLSGVPMPGTVVLISLGLFLITALIEAAITLSVLKAMDKLNPDWIQRPAASRGYGLGALALVAVLLATVGILFASADPDGLEHFAEQIGIADQARSLLAAPLAGYEARFVESSWLSQAAAGMAGLVLIFGAGILLGKMLLRRRRSG